LLVCLELHSIHMDRAKAQKTNPSANLLRAIFGDGCVAVVLSGEAESNISGKWALHGRSSYLTENTTNIVKIVPDEIGFDWNITPELPKLVKGGVNQFIEDLLENQSIVKGDKVDWGIHPGGPAILKACESSLGLEKNELKESWDVLKNFGNMSSATIWFVLQQIMRKEGKNAQNLIALAFGPGVTMEGALFKKY
jgi:alpha-pyrone synthase